MTICVAGFTPCPYIKEGKSISINGITWKIHQQLNCKSFNVVYALICKKENCQKVYIGETKRILKFRLDEHRGYILNCHLNKATGDHFNQPGHSLADLTVTALEKSKRNNSLYRKEREEYFIRLFNTYHNGINKKLDGVGPVDNGPSTDQLHPLITFFIFFLFIFIFFLHVTRDM